MPDACDGRNLAVPAVGAGTMHLVVDTRLGHATGAGHCKVGASALGAGTRHPAVEPRTRCSLPILTKADQMQYAHMLYRAHVGHWKRARAEQL